jgi:hypothetical protein
MSVLAIVRWRPVLAHVQNRSSQRQDIRLDSRPILKQVRDMAGNDKEMRKAVYYILLFLDEKKQKSHT